MASTSKDAFFRSARRSSLGDELAARISRVAGPCAPRKIDNSLLRRMTVELRTLAHGIARCT